MQIKKYINGATNVGASPGASPGATNVGASPGATNVGASPGATNVGASYNHFKSLKQAFNSNICKSINIISFGRVAMLEGFKSAINKIFILKGYKNILIFKIKIMLLIKVNDIIIPDKLTKD